MAVGDLTSGTPLYCRTEAAIKTAIDALNLAATTDFIMVVPSKDGWLIWKVERASS